jgi:hypothetical protein
LAFRIFPTVSQILSFATISLSLSSSQEVKSLKKKVAKLFYRKKPKTDNISHKGLSYQSTVDDLIFDAMELNRDQFYQKYAGLSVRVLQRPKDWKELVFKEWNGLNSLQLSKKYNVSVDMIKRVVDSEMRKRRKDESNGN